MARWVEAQVRAEGIRRAVVFSSAMAQYLPAGGDIRRIVDFVDVDSDKWRQYADKKAWPMAGIYRRESRTLLKFERETAEKVDGSTFVSEEEARLFQELTAVAESRVHAVHNGVDTAFFDPAVRHPSPYPGDGPALVFTGAMDYWPNVDAALWFAGEVFPRVRAVAGEARLFIVGARPTEDVQRLGRLPGITVTGRVEDMRPYLAWADLAVAPLRVARGIQNKVLEAMAMEKVVVASPEAAEGIGRCPALVEVAGGVEDFAGAVIRQLGRVDRAADGRAGRDFVRRRFDWQTNLASFSALLEAS